MHRLSLLGVCSARSPLAPRTNIQLIDLSSVAGFGRVFELWPLFDSRGGVFDSLSEKKWVSPCPQAVFFAVQNSLLRNERPQWHPLSSFSEPVCQQPLGLRDDEPAYPYTSTFFGVVVHYKCTFCCVGRKYCSSRTCAVTHPGPMRARVFGTPLVVGALCRST